MTSSKPKLFQPIHVGNLKLSHRVVLAPMERFRSSATHIPQPKMIEYYAQRASTPGSLLITEATIVAPSGGGMAHVAGISSDEQVNAWRKIVDAVHTQGSYIFMQIAHTGRAADPALLGEKDGPTNPGGPYKVIGPSPIPVPGSDHVPHELKHEEIIRIIDDFRLAAHNAVYRAGFDGVEVHGANGYLVDQFIQDMSNQRNDDCGGSIEKRTTFPLAVIKAVAEEVGPERTALRLSPYSTSQGMHMTRPEPTFAHLVTHLRALQPRLAYLHVVEPRIASIEDRIPKPGESIDFLRTIWQRQPEAERDRPAGILISTGGYNRQQAIECAETKGGLIGFGRHYTSNPDLPARLMREIPLTPYHRSTFYTPEQIKGYSDFPFADKDSEKTYNIGLDRRRLADD